MQCSSSRLIKQFIIKYCSFLIWQHCGETWTDRSLFTHKIRYSTPLSQCSNFTVQTQSKTISSSKEKQLQKILKGSMQEWKTKCTQEWCFKDVTLLLSHLAPRVCGDWHGAQGKSGDVLIPKTLQLLLGLMWSHNTPVAETPVYRSYKKWFWACNSAVPQ